MPEEARKKLSRWQDSPTLQQLFYNRNLRTEEQVWSYVLSEDSQSSDPFQLPDMSTAVERIAKALASDEYIAIYGDYDVDGITATVILVQLLQYYGAKVRPYIPHRRDEGYGLNNAALDKLVAANVSLTITVDCGVRSIDQVNHARAAGMDIIITDHHLPGPTLPQAISVVNPARNDSQYPEKMLPGVTIAFKLAQALLATLPKRNQSKVQIDEDTFLDLVALGTVADLAPMRGENRFLVKRGLDLINRSPRPGIKALIKTTRLKSQITASDISFQLGPRLNAPGRLDTAMKSYKLLASSDEDEAMQLAKDLQGVNRKRQQLTRAITQRALEMVFDSETDRFLLSAADQDFHSGLAGLVASNLSDKAYRPAMIGQRIGRTITGSARSIPEFHITEALDKCSSLLIRHGGHAAAAGFTLESNNWDQFVTQLQTLAKEQLRDITPRPSLLIDAEVTLRDLVYPHRVGSKEATMVEQLPFFEPTGMHNPTPMFLVRAAQVRQAKAVGVDKRHLQLKISHQDSSVFDAIAFGFGHHVLTDFAGDGREEKPHFVDLVFELEQNIWQGNKRLQLNVKDIRDTT